MTTFNPTKALVKHILTKARDYTWTLQGFGMLRTYLPDDVRLHVWDDRYAVPDVSLIHTHPWDFESHIVAGKVTNKRYFASRYECGIDWDYRDFMRRRIQPGEGFKILSDDEPVRLGSLKPEYYEAGESYRQQREEIHETECTRGTVTLVKRVRGIADEADVYYPAGGQWVSGEPRVATRQEVEDICDNALDSYFKTS